MKSFFFTEKVSFINFDLILFFCCRKITFSEFLCLPLKGSKNNVFMTKLKKLIKTDKGAKFWNEILIGSQFPIDQS